MRLDSLNDVLVGQLADLRDAERQLVSALPGLARAATTSELKDSIEQHLETTREHVARLDQVFADLGIAAPTERCEAMAGLIKEGEKVAALSGDPVARDAAIIAAAQRVEHYEIAGYGTARTLADTLGLDDVKGVLEATLDEESRADEQLTKIATGSWLRSGVNEGAMASAREA